MSGIFTAARQINKESWQFTWQHKKLVLGLIALPVLVDFFLTLGLSEEAHLIWGTQYMYLATVVFVLPWMRYMLASHKPTVHSYFTWDKAYFVVMAYTIILFNLPTLLLQQGLSYMGYALFTGAVINGTNFLMYIGALILLGVVMGPFTFIFPAIALDKPFSLGKTLNAVIPFYGQYLISSFFALLRLILIGALAFIVLIIVGVCVSLFGAYDTSQLAYLMKILGPIFLIPIYFWMAYCYTILTGYYKKYLVK